MENDQTSSRTENFHPQRREGSTSGDDTEQKTTLRSLTGNQDNNEDDLDLPLPPPHKSSSMVSSSTYEHPFHLEEMAGMMPTPTSTVKPSAPQMPPSLPPRNNKYSMQQPQHSLPQLAIDTPSNEYPQYLEPDRLPTYDELAESEPQRFKRWRNWIDKRALETRDLRIEERNSRGRTGRRGWDLPPTPNNLTVERTNSTLSKVSPENLLTSSEEQNYFTKLSIANRSTASSPSSEDPPSTSSSKHPSVSGKSSASRNKNRYPHPGITHLTISSINHSIGPKYLPFPFESEPLCAAFLPSPRIKSSRNHRRDLPTHRFTLLGTHEGLWVVDFYPEMTKNEVKPAQTLENARCYQIWHGQPVYRIGICEDESEGYNHQAPCHDESGGRNSPSVASRRKTGVVVMLVGCEDESKSLRVWPLQAIINLTKWRTLTESSSSLDFGSSKEQQASNKHKSALSGIKRWFGDQAAVKGKAPDRMSENVPRNSVESSKSDFSSSEATVRPSSRMKAHVASPSSSSTESFMGNYNLTDSFGDQPLEWACSYVPIHSGKESGTVLFFELANLYDDSSMDDEESRYGTSSPVSRSNSLVSFSSDRRPKESKKNRKHVPGSPFLLVATKTSVNVYKSVDHGFQFVSEYYLPVPPKFVRLLRDVDAIYHSGFTSSKRTHGHSSSVSRIQTSDKDILHSAFLFVGLRGKKRAVMISISDSSVVEITIPISSETSSPSSRQANVKNIASEFVRTLASATSSSSASSGSSFSEHMDIPSLALVNDQPSGHARLLNLITDAGKEVIFDVSNSPVSGFFELEIQLPSIFLDNCGNSTNTMNQNQVTKVIFITRGSTTHVYHSSLPGSPSRGRAHSMDGRHHTKNGSTNELLSGLKLNPIFTFDWLCTPQHVIALCPSISASSSTSQRPGTPNNTENGLSTTLVLVAFASKGLEVKEGTIDLSLLFPQLSSSTSSSKSTRPFFSLKESITKKGAESSLKGKSKIVDEDDELHGTAFFEIGSNTGFLCEEKASWRSSVRHMSMITRPSGALWWAQQLGEWKLLWVGCSRHD